MEITLVKGKIDHTMLGKDCLLPVDDLRCDKTFSRMKYGELMHADIKPASSELMRRSLRQLGLYWACCKLVADNYPDAKPDYQSWNTKEKVSEQCKINNRHIEYYFYYRNPKTGVEQMNIATKSISFSELNHKDAFLYFNDAFSFLASMLDIHESDLITEAKILMESRLY